MDNITNAAPEARTVDAGRGLAWWSEAWAMFLPQAGVWIVMSLALVIGSMIVSVVPVLGGLAVALLMPVFIAGWMVAARKAESGAKIEFNDMFVCFGGAHLTPLIIVGVVMLVATFLVGMVVAVLGAGAAFGMIMGGARHSAGGLMAGMGAALLALVITLAIAFVSGMALWFAPALVVMRNMQPVEALKASLAASMKNIGAMLLFGILFFVASIVASIPFGLGWILLSPVLLLCAWRSYRDVFGD